MREFKMLDSFEIEGVIHELHQLDEPRSFGGTVLLARIHVRDEDSGAVVGDTFYPTVEMATEAFSILRRKALV